MVTINTEAVAVALAKTLASMLAKRYAVVVALTVMRADTLVSVAVEAMAYSRQ